MAGTPRTQQRLVMGVIAAFVLFGVVIVALDWREARSVLGQADWKPLPLAFLLSFVSYACLSYSFVLVSHLFGIRMDRRNVFWIGFVSTVLNHLVTTGGAAGHSLRAVLMRRRHIRVSDILAVSLFHSYFNGLALLAFVPAGLFYLLVKHPLARGVGVAIGVAAGLLVLALLLATIVVFVGSVRAVMFRAVGHAWQAVSHRSIHPSLERMDAAFSRAVQAIRNQPGVLAALVGLIIVDWAACIAVLDLSFRALGTTLAPGVVLTGFAIGVSFGLFSMVPGGIGVQEGTMTGVFALLGVPSERAILAAILFRLIYYVIPFVVSLAFYRPLLRKAVQTSHADD